MPWKDKNKIKAYQARYRAKNKTIVKLRSAEYRRLNRRKIRKASRRIRLNNKLMTYDAYGGRKCCWCGEDDISTLCIDHIDNNGSKHIDNKGHRIGGNRMYNWLKKNNYPDGFQVLCMNCNTAKAQNNGTLPEDRKNLDEED